MKSTRVKLGPKLGPKTGGDSLTHIIRSRQLRELRRLGALEAEPADEVNPCEILPELLRDSLGYMRWIRGEVGRLRVDEFWLKDPRTGAKIPGAEFELEMRLLGVVKGLCELMIRFDLDERGVVVEEAKLEVLSTALREAAREADLSEDQQRRLGSALRTQLKLIEGGAE